MSFKGILMRQKCLNIRKMGLGIYIFVFLEALLFAKITASIERITNIVIRIKARRNHGNALETSPLESVLITQGS